MPDIPAIVQERLPVDQLLAFCRRNFVSELWAFGSVLNDWKPESDVDLLVRFLPDHTPEYFDFCELQNELTEMVGRKVDFVQADWVENPFIRKHIREHRVLIYGS